MLAKVTVYPRREILDPQGKAIQGALKGLGFDQVDEVRAGKSFEIHLDTADADQAGEMVGEMCEKLLANTVVEDYEVVLVEGDGR